MSVGGGGYDLFNAVPRSWAHLIAVMAGKPVAKSTLVPDSFIEYVRALTDSAITPVMTDGAEPWAKPIEQGFNPKNPVDNTIMQTRLAVFPYYKIDPEVNSWF